MPNKRIKSALLPASPALVEQYIALFDQDESNQNVDEIIRNLIVARPHNGNFQDVLIKTCLINDLYGTNVYGTYAMARHIHSLAIDARLATGDISLVPSIAQSEFAGNRIFYSFATKYCNWHREKCFPIYDSIVDNVLWAYRKQFHFHRYKQGEVRIYTRWKEILDAFILYFSLGELTYKQVDKFMWKYGKEVLARENEGA
jgi:hypothetical protein